MNSQSHDPDFRDRIGQITALIDEIQKLPDLRVRKQVQDIVQRLLDLHGTAFERVLDRIASTGPAGLELIDSAGARPSSSAACCCFTDCIRRTSKRGSARPSRRFGPCSTLTAATSSCWASPREPFGCGWKDPVTVAPRRQ